MSVALILLVTGMWVHVYGLVGVALAAHCHAARFDPA